MTALEMALKEMADEQDNVEPLRPLSRSYASLCYILETPTLVRKLLGEKALEFDEMNGCVTLGRKAIEDEDYGVIRRDLELKFTDEKDKPLRYGFDDVVRAVRQAAKLHRFHAVYDYFMGLRWDGERRVDRVAGEILHEDSDTNRLVLQRWFRSVVARVIHPGCKVDTVLVLVGPQGIGKSQFFATLAGPKWFADDPVTIDSKDTALLLRRTLIHEWAELETLQKARDYDTVKAHISKQRDTYRPPYGREVITIPRRCVIVGSTNSAAFLTDPSGNRRYWPVQLTERVDLKLLRQWRDQLWAEVVHDMTILEDGQASPTWWLDAEEDGTLAEVRADVAVRDPWTDLVVDWLVAKTGPVTTAEILVHALDKPPGQWAQNDQKRVAAILRKSGWERRREMVGGDRKYRYWREDAPHAE